jgi:uncharacterized protein YgiM (DUF1202 family)
MSKQQMKKARELINQKRFDEARRILEKIDHPTAREWLARVNKLSPPSPSKRKGGLRGHIIAALLSLVLTSLLIAALVMVTAPMRDGTEPRIAQVQTPVGEATAEATAEVSLITVRQAVVSSSQAINLRAEDNTNSAAVGYLEPGTRLTVMGENADASWYQVQLEDGLEGWVSAALVQLEGEAQIVAQPVAEATEELLPTATPEPTCTSEEVQVWWDSNQAAINRMAFSRYHYENASNLDTNGYIGLINGIAEGHQALTDAEVLGCIADVKQDLLRGYAELSHAYNQYLNNNTQAGDQRRDQGEPLIDNAMRQLEQDYNLQRPFNACGVDVWYAGVGDAVMLFIDRIGMIDANTGPSEEIRAGIFAMQEATNRLNNTPFPDCAATARTHALTGLSATVSVYQAINAQDANQRQAQLNIAIPARNDLLNELRRLGISLE